MIAVFGEFSFDSATKELRRNGTAVSVQAQPLRLLTILLSAGGELVPHVKLCEMLWPDRTVVFDRSLHTAVKQLRRALGDDASEPRYVGTEVGRGYRMLMPITWMPITKGFGQRRPQLRWMALAASLSGFAMLVALPMSDQPRSSPAASRPIPDELQRSLPILTAPDVKPKPIALVAHKTRLPATARDQRIVSVSPQEPAGAWDFERQQWRQDREHWMAARQDWASERPSARQQY